jgi:hypothetical protein
MPSRAEIRVWLEYVLRGIVLAVLAVMFWQSLRQQTESGSRVVRARGVSRASLAEWSALSKAPSGIHLQLETVPSPIERAWLGALAGARSSVTWRGDLSALMVEAQPIASPAGGTKVLVAAPSEIAVVLRDGIGVIDTLRMHNAGASIDLTWADDNFTARVKGLVASTVTRDSVSLRKVLVIGAAGWESKFVVAALEEEGWKVDALIRVAPSVEVAQGPPTTIDTSRYSAVVALDRRASPYASRIVEFARAGGGVVLGREATSVEGLAEIRAGVGGEGGAKSAGRAIPGAGSITLADLAYTPIRSLRGDAAVIERWSDGVATAARRTGAGRVIQLGYEDTWRWRLGGGADAIREHRLWWTRLVSGVAYATLVLRTAENIASVDPAPFTDLVATVGANTSPGFVPRLSGSSANFTAWLFAFLVAALIGEVASRRTRGAA